MFGWIKSSAGLAKIKLRGRAKVAAAFTLGLVAYNLVRLLATPQPPDGDLEDLLDDVVDLVVIAPEKPSGDPRDIGRVATIELVELHGRRGRSR